MAIGDDGLIEVSHRGVLVASHVRRHKVEDEPAAWRSESRTRPARPETVGQPVIRKVDSSGSVSFAAFTYRVGNAYRGQRVEVRVVGDTVEISQEDKLFRSHPVKHDPAKAHGAFANPAGRPSASQPQRKCHGGTGANLSHGYRDLTPRRSALPIL